ncbi:hypothetical protein Tco_0156944 [Tanacetum coccineum]
MIGLLPFCSSGSLPVNLNRYTSSTTMDQDAPLQVVHRHSSALQSPSSQQGVAAGSTIIEDNPFAPIDNDPFVGGRGLIYYLDSGLVNILHSGLHVPKIAKKTFGKPLQDNMADENVPAPAPTRYDDQILPFVAWVPIGKSNYVLDLQKKQKNPIFQISFWNTLTYVEKAGTYRFQLDENWFTLDANLLREALEITPINQAHPFVSPPSGDAIIDFVNKLGYTKEIHFVSSLAVNNLLTKKGRKDKPHVIPCCRFTKLIIFHLGRTHNIHQRSTLPFHLAEEDLRLGNLKFVPKGKDEEEMVAKHDQKVAAKKEGKKKTTSAKQPKPKPAKEKSSKPAPAPKPKVSKERPSKPSTAKPTKPKPAKEKSTKATPLKKADKVKVAKVHNIKSSLQLVDEPDEEPAQPEPGPELEHQGKGEEYDVERAIQMNLELFHAKGHAHIRGVVIREPIAKATRPLHVVEGKDAETVNLKEKTIELDQGQAGLDPGETLESQPPPEIMHDEFMVNVYPNVHESLKFLADEHVILEDPLSSTETLSLMKNLEDAYTIGDQLFNDKSTKDEPGKLNMEEEVFSMKSKNLDNTTQNLGSRVLTLDLRDLPHKIDETVCESVKEAVHVALHAPLRDRFRDLPKAYMKEMLHQWMFESSSYKSHPEHVALYEALEASMKHQSKKRIPTSDTSGSSQPLVPQSSAWKTSDTRESPSSSSKQ